MKLGIIGDIHGCRKEFELLLEEFSKENVQKVISLGDLTDRGPDSPGCVELWAQVKKALPLSVLVRGNHDDKILRVAKHTLSFFESGKKIPIDMSKVDPWQLKNGVSWLPNCERGVKILDTLENSVLIYQHKQWTFVHGGIPTSMQRIPEKINKTKDFMFCRYVSNETGKMISLDQESIIPNHFWGDKYDGRFGKVFFGHQPHEPGEVFKYNHCIAMDTGCVFGGALSGIVLDDENGHMKLIQKFPDKKFAERRKIA